MKTGLMVMALLWLGAAPAGRFVRAAGTVTDRETGLMWAEASIRLQTFNDSRTTCAATTLGGHTGWRVPSIKELHSLVDDTALQLALDPAFRAVNGPLWSSTPGRLAGTHWVMSLRPSAVSPAADLTTHEVICVR